MIIVSHSFAEPFLLNTGFPIWHLYSNLSFQYTPQSNGSSLLSHAEHTVWGLTCPLPLAWNAHLVSHIILLYNGIPELYAIHQALFYT